MLILKMKRPSLFMFQPGQYAFLRVDSIDRTWHPFSIASDPDSNTVEFYIELFGERSWTACLWTKLKNQDKHQKMYIDLLGPYGTALVKDLSYTNIIAIGTGPGIVPCTSLLKQHVRKMLMMEPEHYFAERCEEKKRIINIIGAQEDKNGSLVSHLISTFKGFMTSNQHQDLDEALKASSAESLKSHARRQLIKSR
jgi:predicted ferric reductase